MNAPLPPTPAQIGVFLEDGRYVFRLDDARAIYSHHLDSADVSNCYGECLRTWQPLAPQGEVEVVGDWNVIVRADGSRQWTYKKRPVYLYLNDIPGGKLGDGKEGLWHVVDP